MLVKVLFLFLYAWDNLDGWSVHNVAMGLLPDTYNCRLRMRRECRERLPRYQLQKKPLVNDPGMHCGTCAMHVPWCMSGSLTRGGGENVPGIPGACAMVGMASQITSLTIVYSIVYSGAEHEHQSTASLAFVRGIPRWPANLPHKWPVMRMTSSWHIKSVKRSLGQSPAKWLVRRT